ncbi:MAG: DUF2207 domain-containing protein [Candidatus Aminicenantales bacterium]
MIKRNTERISALKKIFLAGRLLIPFFLLLNSAQAETKNYYFPKVRIDVSIERNGAFFVDEYRTYEFEGRFSWANYTLPLQVSRQGYVYNGAVSDFQVLDERGQILKTDISRSRGHFEAKWYYSARNERRTFHIRYRVRGVIVSYPEVSELYWQVIGTGWDKPARSVSVNVYLPEPVSDRSEILVYGHGPLYGVSEIVDLRTVRFTAENLRSHQSMEIRMVWPAGIVAGIPSSRHTRESIRQEEARFVRETIEQARKAQASRERQQRIFLRLLIAWLAWMMIAPLVWLIFYLRFWKKVGKDYHFENIPEYYRELPSALAPALVETLLREGVGVTPKSFTASIFDMARRGYIEMNDRPVEKIGLFGPKQGYETLITLWKEVDQDSGLLSYEKALLKFLFSNVGGQRPQKGARISLDELKKYLKKRSQKFQKWYLNWMKSIKAEAKKNQFIEPESLRMRNIFMAVTIPLAALTVNPVLGVLGGILIPKIKRRAKPWAKENELWRALDRFLDDFSNFKEVPPEAYKLWEHYLVFGILFGNAKKIIKMLPVILGDERAVVPVWYYGFNRAAFMSSGRLESMIASIHSMSTSILQASTSAAHYSSGGGGGFSGGGGGGGGGSGGGAG